MYCPECGEPRDGDYKFCGSCGAPFEDTKVSKPKIHEPSKKDYSKNSYKREDRDRYRSPDREDSRKYTKDENRCPDCGRDLTYVNKFNRYWCDYCEKYAPKKSSISFAKGANFYDILGYIFFIIGIIAAVAAAATGGAVLLVIMIVFFIITYLFIRYGESLLDTGKPKRRIF